jgi:hypothetical protein
MAGRLEAVAAYRCETRIHGTDYFDVDRKISIPEVKKEKKGDTVKRFEEAAKKLNGMMVDGCYRRTFSRFTALPK